MGLFSKKTFVCERCGKKFEARVAMKPYLCDECRAKEAEQRAKVQGYLDVRSKYGYGSPDYELDELPKIDAYRQQIIDKFQNNDGITIPELDEAGANYRKLTDEQAFDIINRARLSMIECTAGSAYSQEFFVLTDYDRVIVDMSDVFAVGLTTAFNAGEDASQEAILCAIFTNDPYVPAFPMIYLGKIGFGSLIKSKKGREAVTALFTDLCPNLTYPVSDLKQLKKTVKAEDKVRGNIDKQWMLDKIDDASANSGIFKVKNMSSMLTDDTVVMLNNMGYVLDSHIAKLLRMDKTLAGHYWDKIFKKMSTLAEN